jgi:hypothetical protein
MADNDSTLQGLNGISSIALDDLLLVADTSDSYEPKKGTVQKLMDILMSGNGAFTIDAGKLKLSNNLDANNKKIINIASGVNSGEAINYEQIKNMIMGLESVIPGVPVIQDKGDIFRISVEAINNPKGGFYMFYWCVDQDSGTTITLQGGIPKASSSATIFTEGSVTNIVNIHQEGNWIGKYLHCVVRYRNMENESALSGTAHHHIVNPGWQDVMPASNPSAVTNMSISTEGNIIYVKADKPLDVTYGAIYALKLLFNNQASTNIVGNEAGLITMYAAEPIFTYDIPVMKGDNQYVHCRIDTISLNNKIGVSGTIHHNVSLDTDLISDTLMNYLADRMVEKLRIDNGQIVRT